jgi:hypothetical protein
MADVLACVVGGVLALTHALAALLSVWLLLAAVCDALVCEGGQDSRQLRVAWLD